MSQERAVLAGGCFWGMQELLRRQPGVLSSRVGYTGGDVPNATYRNHGTHAEGIEVVFDPERISFRQILEFFSRSTTPAPRIARATTGAAATVQPSIAKTKNNCAWPGKPLSMSTRPACGPARWSRKWRRPVRSGKPSLSTRITWNACPMATPAISCGAIGNCRNAADTIASHQGGKVTKLE